MNDIDPTQRIYTVLAAIPSGVVVSYGQVADLAGLPRAARLVGRALSVLPNDTQLPWHRVVNASGQISMPSDRPGCMQQKQRLQAENALVIGDRISLKQYGWQP